jgi:hypothetical protein
VPLPFLKASSHLSARRLVRARAKSFRESQENQDEEDYQTLDDLNLTYPTLTKEKKNELLEAGEVLMAEKD